MGKGAYMTEKEVHRAEVFSRIAHKQLTRTQAAIELNLSVRQVLRLYKDFRQQGREALRSKRRGKPSNNRISQEIRNQVIDLVSRDIYDGFRPKFMSEKLNELHGIKLSRETARQIMIQTGRWKPNSKKRPIVHQQRKRRARTGELGQIDGSPHAWFESRGEHCSLLVIIDDATGQTFGKFVKTETTAAYMNLIKEYITRFGKPRAFYSDKHSIFRINRKDCLKNSLKTQFGRAMQELDIELICANSPQAKGRVERVSSTLQDRLVKELRLAGVNTIEEANEFLEKTNYWEKHNALFSVPPACAEDAHRSLKPTEVLEDILCEKEFRKLSKNFEFQYKNIIYQINPEHQSRSLKCAYVTVVERMDGTVSVEYKGRKIGFKEYYKQDRVGEEIQSKEIANALKERKPRVVPKNHPWKRSRFHPYAA